MGDDEETPILRPPIPRGPLRGEDREAPPPNPDSLLCTYPNNLLGEGLKFFMPDDHKPADEVAGHTGESHTILSPDKVLRDICMVPVFPRGHTPPRIVPKGTKGAVPLAVALRILREELGIPEHSEKTRKRLAVTTRRSWKRGYFDKNR